MLWLLGAGCGSSSSAVDGGESVDAGSDGGAMACGVGCPSCSNPQQIIDPQGLCTSDVACHVDGDCAATLPSACEQNLGTYTYDFKSVGCLAGACSYRMNSGGCSDLTACSACPTLSTCADRASTGDCVSCFTAYAGDATLSSFICPACASCATSALCNGDAGTSDACADCAIASLTGAGSVLSDPAFRDSCLDAGFDNCHGVALVLLSCRR